MCEGVRTLGTLHYPRERLYACLYGVIVYNIQNWEERREGDMEGD